ncbi:hypothetical protein [Nocardia gamkensis]|uniref:Uncharacterized protein n=1 Tax=Nocardia gamkensis TaxID=352869 RepID=A0A7X6R6W1_9NOCA|nr:hypothetical protein [Nocardia gamkensis]NKY30806.1 hypothetical protein [Nocardia gamkensis]NQE71551.1 hypothetical protein [Nocardia gamkensis]
MADVVMPETWMSPKREILIRARQSMGLGLEAFAERLNELIGPVAWPRVPLTWQAIDVWETELQPPDHVVDAALELLRVTQTPWSVGIDAAGVSA